MELKYKLLAESINFKGAKLYRISALKDFADVKAGDKGGYVQHEDNLSQDGNCWVYDDAKVFGNARVRHNARVFGDAQVEGCLAEVYDDAQVFDSAVVCGNAQVYGDAKVHGRAWVAGSAVVCGNAQVYGDAEVYGNAQIKGDQIIQEGIYNLPKHTPKISKGENKMSRLKELEKMWDEYCKASDINVTDDIQIQLNVSEPRLKVGIFRGDKGMHFTEEEIKALVEVLSTI